MGQRASPRAVSRFEPAAKMLARVLTASLFAAAAHASTRITSTEMAALLSSDDENLATGNGGELKFSVVFSACVGSLDPAVFEITPAIFNNGQCQAGNDQQTYHCTFDANPPAGISSPAVVEVKLPADAVNSIDMPPKGNRVSNIIQTTWYPSFTGQLTTVPNDTTLPEAPVVIEYRAPGHRVWPVGTASLNVTSTTGLAAIQAAAMDPAGGFMTWVVVAPFTGTLSANLPANSVVDIAGNMNMDSGTIVRDFGNVATPCTVGDWNEWSDCSPNCYGRFTPTFEIIEPKKMRSRQVNNPDMQDCGGGQQIPSGTQTEEILCTKCNDIGYNCTDNNPATDPEIIDICLDGSRPFSGEYLGECMGGGQTCGSATNPRRLPDGTIQQNIEASGCSCDPVCETTGDCCQAYWRNNCHGSGPPPNPNWLFSPAGTRGFPIVCDRTGPPNQCISNIPQFDPQAGSYFCWCDAQCVADSSCCNGNDPNYPNSRYPASIQALSSAHRRTLPVGVATGLPVPTCLCSAQHRRNRAISQAQPPDTYLLASIHVCVVFG